MNEEEKGFIIKDRRAFDESGELKREVPPEPESERKEEAPRETRETTEEKQAPPPLPEVNFTSLIFSLSSSALFHLGEVADPQTGEKKQDLPLAKHAIDTIAMLREKTEGNLTDEEKKFIENVLADLRWRYVKAAG
ncbi:MAG: DUF1844 domain-containing protein [Deltaproteobacteria bacterium]|nr:DUF1844 domain-containing protein [Deltaproteobacteria bacterium]MBW1924928.1 DUF1844 domain-containing protein [Deltaproteobacteria bacterium]MBW1949420.1 DUF1844 domain-containing protein [Deltaproteobacteria bacterium]MBW2008266.1 DUF1844 domain-containing protein [Deltaproteobacteria bacterium]MBW2103775.1 DUF1844 domain-containing protein [Deltaproteobacteria bacterium]